MIEHWTDEKVLEAHMHTPHVKEFLEQAHSFIEGKPFIQLYKTEGM